ncbi:hypothetical protein B0H13DRAFT_2435766 [Mycena leptocephala]|nr:hypothetical protein B0H13DRAFT_2435766 [Mycena leptocephala]
MSREGNPKVLAAQLELSHKMLRHEWDRIKHDPSLRFTIVSEVKECYLEICRKPVGKAEIKVCSACKMAIYCSPKCAKLGWRTHKNHCAATKRDGENSHRFKTILKQFPWTDIGYDAHGNFYDTLVLVPLGLLGTSRAKVGYWAINVRGDERVGNTEAYEAPWRPLSEYEGWRLPAAQIPSLGLHDSDACPSFPPTFEETWSSYYQWRGLPMTSPAAILLQWPMSVYACLKELGIEPCVPVPVPGPRRKLTVFYVGARDEIAFIPVFGELALIFPNTDLDLVMFGPSAWTAVERARFHGVVRSPRPCVFEYTAPASCGSGTVRVLLDSNPKYYRPSRDPSEHPDAIVALNAGLGTYVSWHHVVLLSSEFGIPFAVTDYGHDCLAELRMDAIEQALTSTLPPPKTAEQTRYYATLKKVVEEAQIVDVEGTCAALRRERSAKLNEFMEPGVRTTSISLALWSTNAYIQVITPGRQAGKGCGTEF